MWKIDFIHDLLDKKTNFDATKYTEVLQYTERIPIGANLFD